MTPDEVVIADFKTNANPPRDEAGIAESYVEQLALYRAVIEPLYAGHRIRCVLIYTVDQTAHTIPDERLDRALHRLRSGSAPS